jgi:protein-L-isoaspartate(D-aspartate) O-methyltransferase
MVQEQLVARGIKDPRVLRAMGKVPRHLFVEAALADRAYDDGPLPIGKKQTISQPYMVALMTEALELRGVEKVLEIGTGSGYQTAILAELARRVFSIEKIGPLALRARAILDELGYANVAIQVSDGTLGWSEQAPFDAILVTAGSPDLPQPLVEQLSMGGRLVIPLGDEESQMLKRVRCTDSGLQEEELGECRFVKLWGKYGWAD